MSCSVFCISLFKELVVNEYHDRAFHHCDAGFRAVFILAVSGNFVGDKRSLYGRFSGGYLVRGDLSGSQYVSVGEDASYLFPVRHFTEMMQTMLYGGGGFIHLWPSAVILCIFPLLALLLLPI